MMTNLSVLIASVKTDAAVNGGITVNGTDCTNSGACCDFREPDTF